MKIALAQWLLAGIWFFKVPIKERNHEFPTGITEGEDGENEADMLTFYPPPPHQNILKLSSRRSTCMQLNDAIEGQQSGSSIPLRVYGARGGEHDVTIFKRQVFTDEGLWTSFARSFLLGKLAK